MPAKEESTRNPVHILDRRHPARSDSGACALHDGDHLEAVTVRDVHSGAMREIATCALFIMVGAAPNTDWLSGLVELDAKGFVRTGAEVGVDSPFATSRQGIFAVGDVRAGSVKRVA